MIDERTEQLINRRLDGELSEDESLELNKILIRIPEARAMLDEYARNDRMAAEALRSRLSIETSPSRNATTALTKSGRALPGRGYRAVAAAILLAAMISVPSRWQNQRVEPNTGSNEPAIASLGGPTAAETSSIPLFDGPRQERQQLQRNVVGVWDEETQSVYILELDQRAQKAVPVSMNF